jgi:2,4-dienoyl-CoA reductase-like NADH-dependent reductase (Old Yellow Enzyme family)
MNKMNEVFTKSTIAGIELNNKIIRSATYEGLSDQEGIVFVKVNSKTGQPSASGTLSEAFLANAQPSERPNDLTEEKEDLFR